nr:extensin-like [Penaeus vannamei]
MTLFCGRSLAVVMLAVLRGSSGKETPSPHPSPCATDAPDNEPTHHGVGKCRPSTLLQCRRVEPPKTTLATLNDPYTYAQRPIAHIHAISSPRQPHIPPILLTTPTHALNATTPTHALNAKASTPPTIQRQTTPPTPHIPRPFSPHDPPCLNATTPTHALNRQSIANQRKRPPPTTFPPFHSRRHPAPNDPTHALNAKASDAHHQRPTRFPPPINDPTMP